MTLHPLLIEPVVRAALAEDLGRAGDITTTAVVPPEATGAFSVVARQPGTIAGTEAAALAWRLTDPRLDVEVARPDGSRVQPGDAVLTVAGPARGIITGERVALNLLGHLSGIATATAVLVELVDAACPDGPRPRVTCTRKTLPGLRALQKHAVVAGGGSSHRYGLDDAVLIKDNHLVVAGGIRPAVEAARAATGHLVRVEVEVDTLDQLAELLEVGADVVLLDNMAPEVLREAVALVGGRMVTEASGGITADTIGEVASTGVDVISVGWLTHSAPALDLGLDASR